MTITSASLVKNVTTVVSLPNVFTRIDDLINSPNSSLSDIAKVISDDTGLAARLLRIANSAMYNFPSKIDTITRAITVIGTRQLRDLVLATKVIQMFNNLEGNDVDMETFWQHSIACGITARALATVRRESNVEFYYLLGLLHDIGRLIMYIEIPEKASESMQLGRDQDMLLYQAENESLGFDHAAVGAELLSAWKLPKSMCDATLYHHRPSRSFNYTIEATYVHVADLIVNTLQLGSSGEEDIPPLDENAWETLKLPASIVTEVYKQLHYQYQDAVHLFLEADD